MRDCWCSKLRACLLRMMACWWVEGDGREAARQQRARVTLGEIAGIGQAVKAAVRRGRLEWRDGVAGVVLKTVRFRREEWPAVLPLPLSLSLSSFLSLSLSPHTCEHV